MSTESTAATIQAVLNSLPTIAPDQVFVTRGDISGGGYRFTVVFNSGNARSPHIAFNSGNAHALRVVFNLGNACSPCVSIMG